MSEPTVLFCRSGGGIPGIQAHAGMWAALASHGITSTHNAGTSAGAVLSAVDSAGRTPGYAFSMLADLRTKDVVPMHFLWKLRYAISSKAPVNTDGIKRLLSLHLPDQFLYLKKPLTTFMADTRSGLGDWCDGQPDDALKSLRDAVLASMSIRGMFPSVQGFSDGGTYNNCALLPDWHRHSETWLLIASSRSDNRGHQSSALADLLSNFFMYSRGQVMAALVSLGFASDSLYSRTNAVDTLLRRGYLMREFIGADGKVKRVRVLWPKFEDNGLLEFTSGLAEKVMESTRQVLFDMDHEIKTRGMQK